MSLEPIESFDRYAEIWERMQALRLNARLPQATLFVGPQHADIPSFVHRWIAVLVCENEDKPCGQCRACHLLLQNTYPDLRYICPETPGGFIKIEQVRALQEDVYHTPQRGTHRLIVIDPADKMNTFAANALLKILEEPPEHTRFMLIAEHIQSIPQTIVSRCQIYAFPAPELLSQAAEVNYMAIGDYYPEGSIRSDLIQNSCTVLTTLCEILEGKLSLCTAAQAWSQYGLEDFLWLLYLLTAQAVRVRLIGDSALPEEKTVWRFAQLSQITVLLKQLERITTIVRKMKHQVQLNQTLVLEDLLLGYLDAS